MPEEPIAPMLQPEPATKPQNNPKKRWIVGGVAAGAIVLLAGVGALAYNVWFQNPDKVIAEAFSNLLSVKKAKANGTFTIDSSDVKMVATLSSNTSEDATAGNMKLAITPKGTAVSIGTINLSGDGVGTTNGDLYFKVNNLRPAVDAFINDSVDKQAEQYQTSGGSLTAAEIADQKAKTMKSIEPIITKIDNKWVKVSAKDMEQDGDKTQSCVADSLKKIQTDSKYRQDVVEAYKANRFVVIKDKLGSKDGSLGYLLDVDEAAAKKFGKAVEETSFGKELKKCDKNAFNQDDSDTDSDSATEKARVELWVTRWTHQISRVKVDADSDDTKLLMDIKTKVGKSDKVSVPKDTVNFKELQRELVQ